MPDILIGIMTDRDKTNSANVALNSYVVCRWILLFVCIFRCLGHEFAITFCNTSHRISKDGPPWTISLLIHCIKFDSLDELAVATNRDQLPPR